MGGGIGTPCKRTESDTEPHRPPVLRQRAVTILWHALAVGMERAQVALGWGRFYMTDPLQRLLR
jgi:hypothetical protein